MRMSILIFSTSLFLILYTYFLYPFLLFLLTQFKREKPAAPIGSEDLPSVSVIIAAYNEEAVIEKKIRNALALNYPKDKIEILIGSDGSTDKTDTICMQYADQIRFHRVEPRQGKSNVLNTLVPLAKNEILLFTDANTVLQEESLKKLTVHFADRSIGGVCGRLILESRTQGVEAYEKAYWKYESDIKNLESRLYSTVGANGGIYAIRKELFRTIPKDTIIDDFWISLGILKQGKKIYFEKEAIAKETISETIIDEFWRKVRIGSGNLQTLLLVPVIDCPNRAFIHFAYYSHKVIRWMTPLLLIILYISILALSSEPIFVNMFYLSNLLIFVSSLAVILNIKNRSMNLIGYFSLFNFALLWGYIRFIMGKQSVIWKKAAR